MSFVSYADAARHNIVETKVQKAVSAPAKVQKAVPMSAAVQELVIDLEPVERLEKTKLVPLFRNGINYGRICCMCGDPLLRACKDCRKIKKYPCPLVITAKCGHAYHKHCIFDWLMHESYCVGSYTKGFDTDCGIDIDA